jgi:hypothetical protein
MAVALPTLVTGPVKLALVVTVVARVAVAALPVMEPEMGFVTVRFGVVTVPVKVGEAMFAFRAIEAA